VEQQDEMNRASSETTEHLQCRHKNKKNPAKHKVQHNIILLSNTHRRLEKQCDFR